jgi:hypothetical protein
MPGLVDLQIRYSRPGVFSGLRMELDDDARQIVLRTRDDLLVFWHFRTLFSPHLPAGTYKEVVYFLPAAFRFLFDRREDFEEMAPAVIGWVAVNEASLQVDGLLAPARENLLACLGEWTGDFHIELDRLSEWRRALGAPRNAGVVAECLVEMSKYEGLVNLAATFIRGLSYRSSPPFQLAWFLELSLALVPQNRFLAASRAIPLPADLATICQDEQLLHRAALVVLDTLVPLPEQSGYWSDVFSALRIA